MIVGGTSDIKILTLLYDSNNAHTHTSYTDVFTLYEMMHRFLKAEVAGNKYWNTLK